MEANEVTRLILAVGEELGRTRQQMEPIVRKIVQEEWFDTLDSLRSLSEDQWSRFGLPSRFVEKMREKLPVSIHNNLEASSQDWTVEMAPPLEETLNVPVILLVESLAVEAGETGFAQSAKTLLQIVNNVLGDTSNVKYRKLRASNPTLQQRVLQYPSGAKLVEILGFLPLANDPQTHACKTVFLSRFTDLQRQLDPYSTCSSSSFNPFKASFVNAGNITFGVPNGQAMAEREAEMDRVRKETEQLRKKQQEATTADLEKPKLISLAKGSSSPPEEHHLLAVEESDDTGLLLSNMRSLAAAGEYASKFRSRERAELEKLKSKTFFHSAKVRILFRDQKALELTLSSSDTIQGIHAALSSCLNSESKKKDWVLTVTPPLRKLARDSKKTLIEEEFVPSVTLRIMHNSQLCNSFDVLAPEYIL